MDWKYYAPHMKKKSKGMKKADSTTFFSDTRVFQNLVEDLSKKLSKIKFDKLVCIDALGFVLGGALAFKLKKPLVLIRKKGKLPLKKSDLFQVSFKDYSGEKKTLEMNKNLIKSKEKIVLVDNWIMTGNQIRSSIKLIEKAKGKVVGISCIGIENNGKTEDLFRKYFLSYIWKKK